MYNQKKIGLKMLKKIVKTNLTNKGGTHIFIVKQQKGRRLMNIVLCDDNQTFLEDFYQQLQDVAAQWDLTCEYKLYQDPRRLIAADLSATDVLFLDIDMPEINGILAGKELREKYPELIIIFVTGFIEYARDGYSVAAFRYLMKDSLADDLPACMRDVQKKLYENDEHIQIKGAENPILVKLRDIFYVEGTTKRHVILHTKYGPTECIGKLSDIEDLLQDRGFLRIQRSYLVNMRHLDWLKNYTAYLSNGEKLKVSEQNYSKVSALYLRWKGKQL